MFGEYAPEKGTELHASSPEDRLGCFGLLSRKRQNNGNGRGHKKTQSCRKTREMLCKDKEMRSTQCCWTGEALLVTGQWIGLHKT